MNLNFLFFITPFVFAILAVVFRSCITANIPVWLTVNIGRLNANDIRGMGHEQRNYLRKQVSYHFLAAVAVTLLISLVFFFLGNAANVRQYIFCLAIELVLGLAIVLHILKAARIVKASISV